MATKKQAQPADLPTTKSTYVRPSRAKPAVAARAAAKEAALIDAITLAEATTKIPVVTLLTIDDLALEQEAAAAVSDLDVDVETARSLADVGLGPDPFGFDDMLADINDRYVDRDLVWAGRPHHALAEGRECRGPDTLRDAVGVVT